MRAPRAAWLGTCAAFAATAGILLATREEGPAAPRALPVAAAADVPVRGSSPARIRALEAAVRAQPLRVDGRVLLASAYLGRVRETGDGSLNDRADAQLSRALSIRPDDPAALIQRGQLLMARHKFGEALVVARAARRAAPQIVKSYGTLVDALIETGQYGAARRALQEMADRRPDLAALTRISYLRELHGDVAGAIAALRAAASAGGETGESAAFVTSLLGDLELLRGRRAAAARHYREALLRFPSHPGAQHGLARLDWTAGRRARAIARLRDIAAQRPAPEHTLALAEAELAAGRTSAGRAHLRRALREERAAAATEGVPQELTLLEADHGDPRAAVRHGREAWREAPSVRSADALGWALTRSGRPELGLRWARRALRLGSVEPRFRYHAGVAALRAGHRAEGMRWLRAALRRPERLSPLEVIEGKRLLT